MQFMFEVILKLFIQWSQDYWLNKQYSLPQGRVVGQIQFRTKSRHFILSLKVV